MVFHLLDQSISLRGWKPATPRFPSRWRLPALRVSNVLVAPTRQGAPTAAPRPLTGGMPTLWSWTTMPAVSPNVTRVTQSLASFWTGVVDAHRTWGLQSLESLSRAGQKASSMFRSSSWGKHLAAAAAAAAAASTWHQPGSTDDDEPAEPQQSGVTLQQFQASLSRFLTTASRGEVATATMLSDLSNMAYDVSQVSAELLEQCHSLTLVASSLATAAAAAEPTSAASLAAAAPAAPALLHMQAVAPALPAGQLAHDASALLEQLQQLERMTACGAPAILDDDAAFAAAGARAFDSPDADAWEGYPSPVSPRARLFVGAMSLEEADAEVAEQEQAQLAGGSCAAAGVRCIDDGMGCDPASFWLHSLEQQQASIAAQYASAVSSGGSASAPAAATADAAAAAVAAPPSDWFVCDSKPAAGQPATRYFVIQGSITLDHWRINLTIDPTDFVDPSSGIKVHRGVYEAALELYDSFAAMVSEHLEANPGGKVHFTGHSLGGSLATVIALLLVHRGVLPASALAGVHTFGAPAVLCDAAPAASATPADAVQLAGLLDSLGLEPDAITNVIMHRDIVPRAFVCDYSIVASVLKSWVPSFREHTGLADARSHKVLYNFVGNVHVLQPEAGQDFTLPDEQHIMLPPAAALYKLTEPACLLPLVQQEQQAQEEQQSEAQLRQALRRRCMPEDPFGLTLDDAILAFMNCPHPLQTLGEVRAYGPLGSISRFHNPHNYTIALRALR